jgi:DDE family transposase
MVDATPFLPGLSPVQGKAVVARFDGGRLSSEGGLLALREIEHRLGLADRLAGCLKDPRTPEKVVHRLAEIIRFRMLMIAAGYEDGNDADTLRDDPMFKLALDRLPSGEELCSQSTISRLENLPDLRALLRLGRALVEQYCGSFRQGPRRIVLDIDDTFDRVHSLPRRRPGAASSCTCSTPTTTITASSRSSCSTGKGGS